ncbi:unnamed protein product [Ectocarpus sp. 12 AP-2014]
MGCVSSKVGQRPPDQVDGHELKKSLEGQGEAREESRPALPVGGHIHPARTAQSKDTEKCNVQGKAEHHRSGGNPRAKEGEWEEEGETITDVSGLQMRTPRTCADPGLYAAAKSGDLPLVQMILSSNTGRGAAAVDTGDDGTMFQNRPEPDGAAQSSKVADLDERGMWGNTPLIVATQYAHPDIALALIAGGANVTLENERQATALHFSCAEGSVGVVSALLNRGANVDPSVATVHHPGVNGGQTIPLTPLSAAATGGYTELVRLLVQHGVDINRRVAPVGADGKERRSSFLGTDGIGGSALTAAARYGHTETCLLLVDSGANLLLEDWNSRTPLLHAILGGHEQTAMALLDGARSAGCVSQLVGACSPETGGATSSALVPLHAACDKGLQDFVRALVAAGAKVEEKDVAGATALLQACRKGRLECTRELLSKGADPLAEDSEGDTPVSAARSRRDQPGGEEILSLLEAAVADDEHRDGRLGSDGSHRAAGAKINDVHNNGEDEGCDVLTDGSQREKEDGNEDEEDVLLVSDWDPDGDIFGDIFDDNCNVAERCGQSRQSEAVQNFLDPAAVNADENDDEDDVLLVGDYDSQLEEEEFLDLSPAADEREDTTVGTRENKQLSQGSDAIPRRRSRSLGEGRRANGSAPQDGTESQAQAIQDLHHPQGVPENDRQKKLFSAATTEMGLGSAAVATAMGQHQVAPGVLEGKLVALQVAGGSVDSAMIAATNNVVAARSSEGA